MAEYIERERVVDVLVDMETLALYEDAIPAIKNIRRLIDGIPADDVAPVRHGRWVKARGSWCTPGGDPVWECSECGKGVHVYGIEHGTYGKDVAEGQWVACPNCGAKMDGESGG